MSRKHFIAIAKDINYQVIAAGEDHDKLCVIRNIANDLSGTFATLNANFNKTRFMTACGF